MPCTDAIAQETIVVDGHSEENHEDFCSPFCVCQCCGNIATNNDMLFYNITFKKIDSFTHVFSYKNEYFMNVNNSVWHPPTLS